MSGFKVVRHATRWAAGETRLADTFDAALALGHEQCEKYGADVEVRTLHGAKLVLFQLYRRFADDHGKVVQHPIDLPRSTPQRPQTRADYDSARAIRYRQRREAAAICNPTSIHYHYLEAQREKRHFEDAMHRFNSEWRFHDRYTATVNERWSMLAARLKRHQQQRIERERSAAQRAATAAPIARRDVAGTMAALRSTWGVAA